jgi:UDP-2,3-diacylglucosamine pyrophosphatase LpxH
MSAKTHYRSIFISDVHLGTPGCRADALLSFLRAHSSDHLYLIGDIVDFWSLSRRSYFPQDHVNVLRKFLSRSAQGTRVIYIPGNHDEAIRSFLPVLLGGIDVVEDCIHVTADGRKFFVVHGDVYDQVVKYAKWLAWMGDIGYHLLLRSNRVVNCVRRRFGLGYWSLSAHIKQRVKAAVNFIGSYEDAVSQDVRTRGADGVICGHIHHAEIKPMGGVLYCNTGDWVESCTAVVEHNDGRLELVHWASFEAVKETENDPELSFGRPVSAATAPAT